MYLRYLAPSFPPISQPVTQAAGLTQEKLLEQAVALIEAHKPTEAINGPLDQVIAHFEKGPAKQSTTTT